MYIENYPIIVHYMALHKVTGLTDVTLKTYDPTGALIDTILLTEIIGSNGVYTGIFTPNIYGTWRIAVTSVSNGDTIGRDYIVEHYDNVVLDINDLILSSSLNIFDNDINGDLIPGYGSQDPYYEIINDEITPKE